MVSATDATHQTPERRIDFVKLPETVDCANVRTVMDSLAGTLARHPSVLVVDGTAMEFCDCACISALICAERWAASIGTQLRLVVTSLLARRVIQLTAADEVLDIYATMDDALADITGRGVALSSGLFPRTGETEEPYGQHTRADH